ncbi:helix-turn-helix domain-containing protein [Rhodococcus sp. NPDC059968]|uniref:helix-turn-helix domain-containing protein n=1 Tax=Rhodococcus sp. NPDC059968 TaxID=3347017 RepID=UPI00366A7E59
MALNPLFHSYADRFKRGEQVTAEQHAEVFYNTPCIPSTGAAVEYVGEVFGANLKPSFIRQAVREGALDAYRIGNGYHFAPRDIDTWLESLRTSA